MKKIQTTLVLFLALAISATPLFAKPKITSGDPKLIKGKTFKVQFVYDGMSVGKFKTEDEYLNKKKSEYNAKEAGRGDKWAASWKADRSARFEPSFISKFNELGTKTSTAVSKEAAAGGYTLVITTTFTEPGFNVAVMRQPAYIDVTCEFKDASGKTILSVTAENVPGQTFGGYDFDTGVRLSECYEKLGKDLYNVISKKF